MLFFKTWTPQTLSGEKIYLSSLRKEEIPQILQWLSEPETAQLAFGMSSNHPQVQAALTFYKEEMKKNRDSFFAVHLRNGLFIGFCRYVLSSGKKFARIGIVIGKPEHRGKGYGKEAVTTLLHYLFWEKKVPGVELDTTFFNFRARGCFEACGFQWVSCKTGEGTHDCLYEIQYNQFLR